MSDILLGPLYLPSLCIFGCMGRVVYPKGKTDCEHRGSDEFWGFRIFLYGLSICYLFILVYLHKRLYSKTVTGSKGWEKPLHHPSYFRSNGDVYFSGFKTNTIGIVLFLMVLFYYWICTLNILKSMFPFC